MLSDDCDDLAPGPSSSTTSARPWSKTREKTTPQIPCFHLAISLPSLANVQMTNSTTELLLKKTLVTHVDRPNDLADLRKAEISQFQRARSSSILLWCQEQVKEAHLFSCRTRDKSCD